MKPNAGYQATVGQPPQHRATDAHAEVLPRPIGVRRARPSPLGRALFPVAAEETTRGLVGQEDQSSFVGLTSSKKLATCGSKRTPSWLLYRRVNFRSLV